MADMKTLIPITDQAYTELEAPSKAEPKIEASIEVSKEEAGPLQLHLPPHTGRHGDSGRVSLLLPPPLLPPPAAAPAICFSPERPPSPTASEPRGAPGQLGCEASQHTRTGSSDCS